MAYFLMKFANFCCYGNKGGSNKNFDDSVWLTYPQTPSSVQKSGTYLYCKLSYGEFCAKISKFLLPWQQELFDTNFTYTVKSADPENPLFGARILMISHTQAEL